MWRIMWEPSLQTFLSSGVTGSVERIRPFWEAWLCSTATRLRSSAPERGRTWRKISAATLVPSPEGYRKARRLMEQAEKFRRPIVTLIDTSGAYPGLEAEARGQGEAIARNLLTMSQLTVPVVAVILGEGNSGGALALAVADRVLMLEHSVYAILSPEGFASILWKDAGRSGEAANLMKLTAPELLRLRVIDEVILEPAGGAHLAPAIAYREVDQALFRHLSALSRERGSVLTAARYEKFRRMGVVLPNEDAPRKEEP